MGSRESARFRGAADKPQPPAPAAPNPDMGGMGGMYERFCRKYNLYHIKPGVRQKRTPGFSAGRIYRKGTGRMPVPFLYMVIFISP